MFHEPPLAPGESVCALLLSGIAGVNRTVDHTWTNVLPPVLLCSTTAPSALRPPPPLSLVGAIAMRHAYRAAVRRMRATRTHAQR